MENCQRCDAELNGRWYAKCGEDNATPRISFGNLLREFFVEFVPKIIENDGFIPEGVLPA